MNGQDIDTFWRAFNAIGALIALLGFAVNSCRRWGRLTERGRLYAEVIMAFLTATMVGSIENILQDNPIGSRTFLTTAAICWTLYAVHFTSSELVRDD